MNAKKALEVRVRAAVSADIPILRELIEASVRGLQAQDYTRAQLEGALKSVYGVDSRCRAKRGFMPTPATRLALDVTRQQ